MADYLRGEIVFIDKDDNQIFVNDFSLEEGNARNGLYIGKSENDELNVTVSINYVDGIEEYHISWNNEDEYQLDSSENLEIINQDQLFKLCVCLNEIINSSLDDDSKNKFGYALGDAFNLMLLTINEKLDMDLEIRLQQLLSLSDDELSSLFELWNETVETFDNSFSLDNETFEYEFVVDFENNDVEEEDIPEPQADSKASSAILKFFDSNSNTLVAKLKESGLQLSAVALRNDQNIARVANVVYNLLPGMVRIFVSYDTVENFLLNNRQWLINKLV